MKITGEKKGEENEHDYGHTTESDTYARAKLIVILPTAHKGKYITFSYI